MYKKVTSESMLLRVGLTKSVVVTIISGTNINLEIEIEMEMEIENWKNNLSLKRPSVFSLMLVNNLVLVWNVVQGVRQGDLFKTPKIDCQLLPGTEKLWNNIKHVNK